MTSRIESFDRAMSAKARFAIIGVGHYAEPAFSDVRSAPNNAIAWLIQAMRMGISPSGNTLLTNPGVANATVEAQLDFFDLEPPVKRAMRGALQEWGVKSGAPTHAAMLHHLSGLGNHLDYDRDCRLLLVYSGHGALDDGRFVLCPEDVTAAANDTPVPDLRRAVQGNVQRGLGHMRVDHPGSAANAPRIEAALRALVQEAKAKRVLREVCEILLNDASEHLVRHYSDLVLTLLDRMQRNLAALPAQAPRQRQWGRTITSAHMMLILGAAAPRITVILDACRSGGPGRVVQGSVATHDWHRAGFDVRILASGQKGQQSAEAKIGNRWYGAGTWALSRVLGRWRPVHDGASYAMGIRNGDLVLRANVLLDALSFNQTITLSGPKTAGTSPADMPFCGLHPATPTHSDPTEQAGGIQLSADSNSVIIIVVRDHLGAYVSVLVAVGSSWSSGPQGSPNTVSIGGVSVPRNKLYVFYKHGGLSNIGGGDLDVYCRVLTATDAAFGNTVTAAIAAVSASRCAWMPAENDPGEQAGPSSGISGGYHSGQVTGGKPVCMKWSGSQLRLWSTSFPIGAADFDPDAWMTLTWDNGTYSEPNGGYMIRNIPLPAGAGSHNVTNL